MLTQTALQSAFENPPELAARTNGGTVGYGEAGDTGEFDEMLTDKLIPTDAANESSDAVISDAVKRCLTVLKQAPASNTTLSKSSPLNDYLGGFNALSGLLVRFWKKKELVDIEKNADKDHDDENDGLNYRASEEQNTAHNAADELSELSRKKKKEQRSTTEQKI